MPPISLGTPVNIRPASFSIAKSVGSSAHRFNLVAISDDHPFATASTFFWTEVTSIFATPYRSLRQFGWRQPARTACRLHASSNQFRQGLQ
jgi:hypothetical protein